MTKKESIERIDELIYKMKESIKNLEDWKKCIINFDNNIEGLDLENGFRCLGISIDSFKRIEVQVGREHNFYTKSFISKSSNDD